MLSYGVFNFRSQHSSEQAKMAQAITWKKKNIEQSMSFPWQMILSSTRKMKLFV